MVIKKCISLVLLLVTITVVCSCVSNSTDSSITTSTVDTQSNDNSLTSLDDNEPTTESIIVPYYDVNSLAIDMTFDEIVDECLDYTGFDDPRSSEEVVSNDDLVYFPVYSYYLDIMTTPDSTGYSIYQPLEYEYHIERGFTLLEASLWIDEYDSEEWAKVGFTMYLDSILKSEDLISIDRHESEGYYFAQYDYCYEVEYLVGNCVIYYRFPLNDNGTDVMYTTYMNICDELGLPISAEMAAEILG
ncbi:MAG: hypothetical protein GXZ12_00055 [Clostridiaceae bacterium]|jgi:hypothetical protein|nr:hypothetical protein [Clostridiaceae bacterium]